MQGRIFTKPSTLSSRATIHPRAGDGVMSKSSTWNSLTRRRCWDQSRDSSKTVNFVLSTDLSSSGLQRTVETKCPKGTRNPEWIKTIQIARQTFYRQAKSGVPRRITPKNPNAPAFRRRRSSARLREYFEVSWGIELWEICRRNPNSIFNSGV
jgi:hypothetical protein